MSPLVPSTRRRLRRAAIFVLAGLIIAAASLCWIHPLAFMGFLILGCGSVAVGIAQFLWALVIGDWTSTGD